MAPSILTLFSLSIAGILAARVTLGASRKEPRP